MAEQGARAAMAEQGAWNASMAEQGAWDAMEGSPPPKIFLGEAPHLRGALGKRRRGAGRDQRRPR